MKISKDWVIQLSQKYKKDPKDVRKALWPKNPTKGLDYLNRVNSIGLDKVEILADTIGCSVDELLRRPLPTSHFVAGNGNNVGNISINTDIESLNNIISSQKQIIDHQEKEISRMNDSYKSQLKVKDKQIAGLKCQIDDLIKLAQQNGNQ